MAVAVKDMFPSDVYEDAKIIMKAALGLGEHEL